MCANTVKYTIVCMKSKSVDGQIIEIFKNILIEFYFMFEKKYAMI